MGPRVRVHMSGPGGTDPGHRRRPGPRQAPMLLKFGRETPGFHPGTVLALIQELRIKTSTALGINTSSGN